MEKIELWTDEKLHRKRDQAFEMASLAMQDGDKKDAERRMAEAEEYRLEIVRRQ